MNNSLLIIFVKNAILGQTKTRLAKTIGDEKALLVYDKLLMITENAVQSLQVKQKVLFSNHIEDKKWAFATKGVQQGNDLGERMANAFISGFEAGYEKIVLIGSDCPEISEEIIKTAFQKLGDSPIVFGPAVDGGYYLVGLSSFEETVFKDKPWSKPDLLKKTLNHLQENQLKYCLLSRQLNDIDTFDDLVDARALNQDQEVKGIIQQHLNIDAHELS